VSLLRRTHSEARRNWKLIAALVLIPQVLYIPVLLITRGERLDGPQWLGWLGLGIGLVTLVVYAVIIVKKAFVGTILSTAFAVGAFTSLLGQVEKSLQKIVAGHYYNIGIIALPIELFMFCLFATTSGLIMMGVTGIVARFVESRAHDESQTESQLSEG